MKHDEQSKALPTGMPLISSSDEFIDWLIAKLKSEEPLHTMPEVMVDFFDILVNGVFKAYSTLR